MANPGDTTAEGGVMLDIAGCPKCILSAVEYYDQEHGLNRLELEHDGSAQWIDLQKAKNAIYGDDYIFLEIYPPQNKVVNGQSTEFHYRHLWLWSFSKLGPWPNIRPDGV